MTQKAQENFEHAFPIFHRKTEKISTRNFVPSINQFQADSSKQNNEFPNQNDTNHLLENENYDAEMDQVFIGDQTYNPFFEPAKIIKKIADEFLNQVKTNFPNRYFILKKITQNTEFWEICVQKGYVIINEEASYKKLLNCIEVSVFLRLSKQGLLTLDF